MKNQKTFLILGIIAFILVLGVGYAVVSAVDITFGGTVTVGDAPIKVGIYNAQSTTTGNAIVTHSWKNQGEITDSFTISDIELNETVTITYTLKNTETDVTAVLSEVGSITNSNTEYFEVTKTNNLSELEPGKTGTVVIKVKLKKTPVEEDDATARISFTVRATAKSYEDDFLSGGGSN